LPPDLDQSLLEGRVHCSFCSRADYIRLQEAMAGGAQTELWPLAQESINQTENQNPQP
jgi:hypothetical protein